MNTSLHCISWVHPHRGSERWWTHELHSWCAHNTVYIWTHTVTLTVTVLSAAIIFFFQWEASYNDQFGFSGLCDTCVMSQSFHAKGHHRLCHTIHPWNTARVQQSWCVLRHMTATQAMTSVRKCEKGWKSLSFCLNQESNSHHWIYFKVRVLGSWP